MPFEISYENHYVAFVDVLGFRNLLAKNATSKLNEYFRIVRRIQSDLTTIYGMYRDGEQLPFRVTSDSIIWATPARSIDDLKTLCHNLAALQTQCAMKGIWLRGGISKGNFCREDDIMVGTALADAYELESKQAKYPRIIVDPRILTAERMTLLQFLEAMGGHIFGDPQIESGELRSLKLKDAIFVDYLGHYMRASNEDQKRLGAADFVVKELGKTIYAKQEHYEKHLWTRDYLLEVLCYGGFDFIGLNRVVERLERL